MANDEWLENRPTADMSKRAGPPKAENFGAEGTFKQLPND